MPSSNLLELHQLTVRHGRQTVLSVDALEFREGEVLAVIGPNGAGKSTLLLVMANLIKPSSGQMLFHGQPVLPRDELAYRRRIGLVLQEPLLLDDSVAANVASGLRFRGLPKDEIDRRVAYWLNRLGITALAKRSAHALSGGEAQRASLARAFALQADLILLDEPFSALDKPTRLTLLEEFQTLLAETHQSAVFITHDLEEALMIGQRVAVLVNGQLRQIGRPEEVFSAPSDPEVAAFVGVDMVLPGRSLEVKDGLVRVAVDGFQVETVGNAPAGRDVYVCLRPEDLTLWPEGQVPASSARNRLSGRIIRLFQQGPLMRVSVDCGFNAVALVTRASAQEMNLQVGQQVALSFKASAAHLISR